MARPPSIRRICRAVPTGGAQILLSAPSATDLGTPGDVTWEGETARWSYPQQQLTATVRADQGRLKVTLTAAANGSIEWPVSGTDAATKSIQWPLGDGLTIPVGDAFWNSAGADLAGSSWELRGGLRMPFWGYTIGGHGASYIVPTDVGTTLDFRSAGGRLSTSTVHTFDTREGTLGYEVNFALTGDSPIASGKDYRAWLDQHNAVSTLAAKAQANPDVGKLAGGFHAYLWGAGRDAKAISELKGKGIDKLLLSWDADSAGIAARTVTAAKNAGYLAGPYDTWANAQDPKSADAPTSKWPGTIWPDACIIQENGEILPGFGGRGCYVSTEAMAKREPTEQNLAKRVQEMTATGPNAYFLDVDAAGELFSDYSTGHPMNLKKDAANRLDRMAWLVNSHQLVSGGETVGSWANKVVSFSHGSSTPNVNGLWPFERDRETFGRWWPEDAPEFFFKPVTMPDNLARQMFDPRYRVPLFETVLHDSVVSTDRWELSHYKFPALTKNRFMLNMIGNTPLNLVLDGPTIDSQGAEIAEMQQYFKPLHQAAFNSVLTDFTWLTADRLVQRSRFSDKLTITANFGAQPYEGLPAGCVDARLQGDAEPRRLCPN